LLRLTGFTGSNLKMLENGVSFIDELSPKKYEFNFENGFLFKLLVKEKKKIAI
jgi:hypothetical protein